MKQPLWLWQFSGFAISTFLGTVLHFVYGWTNGSIFVAPFSAINESTWEHMKLLFFPTFLFAILQSLFLSNGFSNFWKSKFWGILLGLSSIPILFYTFLGSFGNPPAWLNILFFFLSVGLAYFVEYLILIKSKNGKDLPIFYLILLCGIGFLFVIFTFFTPQLPLFQDPISGTYGI